MTLKLEASSLRSIVELPGSKSHANRYLILASRLGGGMKVRNLPLSDDVVFLIEALKEVGLEIEGESDLIFKNKFPECEQDSRPLLLNVGEGGTTARFLTALLCAGKRPYVLQTHGRLSERPWDELISALNAAGAKIEWRGTNLHVQGPVDIKKLPQKISASRSTQFASALRLAFAKDGYTVTPEDLKTSTPYWLMTEESVKQMNSGEFVVPLDWSSAAFPLSFAAVKEQKIYVPGLVPDAQADRALFDVLQKLGVASSDGQGVHIQGAISRRPIEMDIGQCPDLTPALAFLAAHLEGTSSFVGASILRHKESDRLAAIISLLHQCGTSASYDEQKDCLYVRGRITDGGPWDLEVPSDHRLVMVAALFCMAHKGGTIPHRHAVRKSFPDFFDLFVNNNHSVP